MKKLIAVIATVAALTGCAASPTGNFNEIDCTAKFNVKTFPVNGFHEVKINAVRENRFSQKQYRLSVDNKEVKFINRWQDERKFIDLRCKNG